MVIKKRNTRVLSLIISAVANTNRFCNCGTNKVEMPMKTLPKKEKKNR